MLSQHSNKVIGGITAVYPKYNIISMVPDFVMKVDHTS